MLDPEIGVQLQGRGWDVESIQRDHRDLIGARDEQVLDRCIDLERGLVTDNVRHFVPLFEQFIADQRLVSLVLASPKRYPRGKRTIGVWVDGLETFLKSVRAEDADGISWLS